MDPKSVITKRGRLLGAPGEILGKPVLLSSPVEGIRAFFSAYRQGRGSGGSAPTAQLAAQRILPLAACVSPKHDSDLLISQNF